VETKFMNMNYLPNAYSVVRKKAAPDSTKK
jgi:penicillin-binding protein 2